MTLNLSNIVEISTQTRNGLQILTGRYAEKKQEIDQVFDDLIQRLQRRRENLQRELSELYEKESELLKTCDDELATLRENCESLVEQCQYLSKDSNQSIESNQQGKDELINSGELKTRCTTFLHKYKSLAESLGTSEGTLRIPGRTIP